MSYSNTFMKRGATFFKGRGGPLMMTAVADILKRIEMKDGEHLLHGQW